MADYTSLKSCWDAALGGSLSFTWTYPTHAGDPCSGQSYTVRFAAENPFDVQVIQPGYVSVSVTLSEV